MNATSIEALREVALRPKIEEGTTVRFKVTYSSDAWITDEMRARSAHVGGRTYTFVAILLGGAWYTTAQVTNTLEEGVSIRPKMSQASFANVLRDPRVSDIQVVTAWEAL